MKTLIKTYIKYLYEQKRWSQNLSIEKGKMKKLLGLKPTDKICDIYTSGKDLAEDLVNALNGDKKEASSMLAFAANIDPTNNVLDTALKHISAINTIK